MGWQEEVAERVKEAEEEVESYFPRSYAARTKMFLDRFLPASLLLLGSLVILNFLGGIQKSTANLINYLNWVLICYFSLRLAMAFRLAESDREFLKNHWFDALIVIPAFSLVQEFRGFRLLGQVRATDEAATGLLATRNAGLAAQVSKIVRILKKSLTF